MCRCFPLFTGTGPLGKSLTLSVPDMLGGKSCTHLRLDCVWLAPRGPLITWHQRYNAQYHICISMRSRYETYVSLFPLRVATVPLSTCSLLETYKANSNGTFVWRLNRWYTIVTWLCDLFIFWRRYTVKPRPEAHMDMILFEEHWLDSTTTDITTALFILEIMSLYYLILWNQVDILQKHFKKDHVHMRLWTRLYGNEKWETKEHTVN